MTNRSIYTSTRWRLEGVLRRATRVTPLRQRGLHAHRSAGDAAAGAQWRKGVATRRSKARSALPLRLHSAAPGISWLLASAGSWHSPHWGAAYRARALSHVATTTRACSRALLRAAAPHALAAANWRRRGENILKRGVTRIAQYAWLRRAHRVSGRTCVAAPAAARSRLPQRVGSLPRGRHLGW